MQSLHRILQNIISYNEMEVRSGGSKDDIQQGHNIWVHLTDPTYPELRNVMIAKTNRLCNINIKIPPDRQHENRHSGWHRRHG